MTSTNEKQSIFAELLSSGTVPHSRRDLMRATAAIAASSALGVPAGIFSNGVPARARQDDGAGDAITLHLPFNPFGQEVSVDPHRTVNWGPFWVMLPYAWSGLLRFDENGAVETDLAESVVPSEDGTVWTATLRADIAFADGTRITAHDFVRSWQRALDSSRLSPMFRFMEPIVNAGAIAIGESEPLGAIALDDSTVEITLNAPLAAFPSYLATFVYAVVHPDFNGDSGELELNAACSGAWTISNFTADTIHMVPNPHHWSPSSADIAEITWHIAPGGNTDLTLLDWYMNDQIAITDSPPSVSPLLDDSVKESEQHRAMAQSSTYVMSLDFHQAPFGDVRVRRAFAAAVNRELWASEIEQDDYVPASSFSPTVLASIASYEAPTDSYDDDIATLLSEAEVNPAESEDQIICFQPADDTPEQIERTAQLLQMISDAAGFEITHDTSLTAEQITAARQDVGGLQIGLTQWQLDSDQPTLLQILSQDGAFNTGYVNWDSNLEDSGDYTPGADAAHFDELVTTARQTLDEAERNSLYAEAEGLLLRNAVLIPLGFWNPSWLQKPWLLGTRQGPWSGSTPVRIDAEVTIDREIYLADEAEG